MLTVKNSRFQGQKQLKIVDVRANFFKPTIKDRRYKDQKQLKTETFRSMSKTSKDKTIRNQKF